MGIKDELLARAESKCELCGATDPLEVFPVPPATQADSAERCVLLCPVCRAQAVPGADMDAHHWRALNETMWTPVAAVQVMAWRLLTRLSGAEAWARDLLDTLYLDDEALAWAKAGEEGTSAAGDESPQHRDCHGVVLASGDTVTLIKDLNVKGANFTAKRGTAVRGISLVLDTPTQIEGRINGQQIVILTEFVKKS
ncbi:MAG: hypothetical protein A2516_11125 [Alphaproteobacteria bacterium RIFOXYD12_FULL_60_8]|nr:MAG: hypothetical protein A2516_11125 [Alphaproteobacteria bacterium RIFOXYD12_FULL_60_8]